MATYERDKLGRITRKTETVLGATTVHDYDYDLAGRLDQVHRDAKLIADYTYDLNGNRVGLVTPGGNLSGTYDDQDRMLSYGDCTYEYRLSGELATRSCGSEVTHYDTFVRVLVDTNPGFQPFGFAGGLYDRDTGLVRFGARDYDPEAGRWTAKDRTLFRGYQPNLYAYLSSDPINAIDLSGNSRFGELYGLPKKFGTGIIEIIKERGIKIFLTGLRLRRSQRIGNSWGFPMRIVKVCIVEVGAVRGEISTLVF